MLISFNKSQLHAKFIDNIKTVALPPVSDASKTFEGTLATVSGFGITVDGKSLLFKLRKHSNVSKFRSLKNQRAQQARI
jgi:hypothetical protein